MDRGVGWKSGENVVVANQVRILKARLLEKLVKVQAR